MTDRSPSAYDAYCRSVFEQMTRVRDTQRAGIEQAGAWLGEALAGNGWLYAFGTGHSHLLAEEIFFRAGGLARAIPILDEDLMLHRGALRATRLEREIGYAKRLLDAYPMAKPDLLIVASNSGRNAVPIEMALGARQRGARVVAITNLTQSGKWPSRHPTGQRLTEAADLTIDNCGVSGDACVETPGMATAIGPASTLTGCLIVNLIVAQGIEEALRRGVTPEVYVSSNTEGDARNEELINRYRTRIRLLR